LRIWILLADEAAARGVIETFVQQFHSRRLRRKKRRQRRQNEYPHEVSSFHGVLFKSSINMATPGMN
jgi:hypothetical protein